MRILSLDQPGSLVWREVSEPVAGDGEALVKVRRCGVCGTDMHALAGRQPFFSYPRVLGHELCVEILSAPSGSGLQPGDLCSVEAYAFCGTCPACRSGRTNCCSSLKVLGVHVDGGHVPLMTLPAERLHPARGLDPDQIALVEPLVIGAHGIERAAIHPGETVAVIGMGPIGLAAAVFAKAAGANLACVDVQAARLDFGCGTMGLGTPLAAGEDLRERLRERFGQLPSVIIDATGNAASMKGVFDLAEQGGRIVFLGLFQGEMTFDDPNFHRRELTLMASRAALTATFRDVILMMEEGRIDVLPMITHRFSFTETDSRLPRHHAEPGLVKAMIDYDQFH